MRNLLIVLSGSFLYCSFALAQETETTFDNANSAYNAGQFENAVMLYKEILESGQQVPNSILIWPIPIIV